MSATVLDGRALAKRVREELAREVEELARYDVVPGLAVILVGDDPASAIYVRNKKRAAASIGVQARAFELPASASQSELLDLVARQVEDATIDGLLVQMPVPAQIDPDRILDAIPAAKDVDGFHPENIGLLAQGRPRFVAATPRGCMRLIEETGVSLEGKRAVVIGRSNNVGKPMAMLLTNANATVTLCHSRTWDLDREIARADVVVAALGRAEAIRGAWIKEGAVVIDVGINRRPDGTLVGDVEFPVASERASFITPVPRGVGPMTVASLLENTIISARLRADEA